MTTEKALGFPVPFPGATSSAVRAAVFESCVREYIDRHGIERPKPAQATSGREASN